MAFEILPQLLVFADDVGDKCSSLVNLSGMGASVANLSLRLFNSTRMLSTSILGGMMAASNVEIRKQKVPGHVSSSAHH